MAIEVHFCILTIIHKSQHSFTCDLENYLVISYIKCELILDFHNGGVCVCFLQITHGLRKDSEQYDLFGTIKA